MRKLQANPLHLRGDRAGQKNYNIPPDRRQRE